MRPRVLVSNFFYKNKYHPTSSHDYSGFLAIIQAKINGAGYTCIEGKTESMLVNKFIIYRELWIILVSCAPRTSTKITWPIDLMEYGQNDNFYFPSNKTSRE